jgi:hypothetical protein
MRQQAGAKFAGQFVATGAHRRDVNHDEGSETARIREAWSRNGLYVESTPMAGQPGVMLRPLPWEHCAQLLTTPPSGGKQGNLCAPGIKQLAIMSESLWRGLGCKLCTTETALAPDAVVFMHGKCGQAPHAQQENSPAKRLPRKTWAPETELGMMRSVAGPTPVDCSLDSYLSQLCCRGSLARCHNVCAHVYVR